MPVKGRGRPNMDIPFSDEIARDLQDQGHHVPVLKEVLTVEKDIRIEAVLGKKSRQQMEKSYGVRGPQVGCDTNEGRHA
jgi:hypothetical protein